MSVMTLNLRFGLADDGRHAWPHRKAAVAGLLTEQDADVYAFQEANDFQILDLRRMLPDHDCIGQRLPAPAFWQNNVIFYRRRFDRIFKDHFFLSPTPDIPSRFRDSKWPRQCTIGTFAMGNATLTCVNTHLDFDTGVQVAAAELILDRLAGIDGCGPVILMGDFNAEPQSPCHTLLTGKSGNGATGRRLFKDAMAGRSTGTHHGFTGRSDGRAIDWILYSAGIEPIRAEVIDRCFDNGWPSDHFPVAAEFSVDTE